MATYQIYIASLVLFSCVCALCVFWSLVLAPGGVDRWERLPRNVWLGLAFGAAALAWCVPHSKPIAPDFLVPWLIPAALACLWLCYQFLDYLFSRALGGFLILLAHYLLYSSFIYQAPFKPFFSVLCYGMGTLGIFFCGKPHLMRDFIRRICRERGWRYSAVALFAVYCLTSLYLAVSHMLES